MSEKTNYYRTVFLGVIIGFCAFGLIINIASNVKEDKPQTRVKVIDKYQNCDIIRYAPEGTATYAYFLDCPTQRHLVYKK